MAKQSRQKKQAEHVDVPPAPPVAGQKQGTFNLLRKAWLPVRYADGRKGWISPSEVSSPDLVAIDSGRADFDGALWQFVIGLLQTAFCPEDHDDWSDRYERPPARQELEKAFSAFDDAFWLDGDGPRYMQERQLLRESDVRQISVEEMLGESLSTVLFFNPASTVRLGPEAVAMALTAMQINAWAKGRGHRSGLRGAGALSTLVHIEGESLWRNCWLNVLTATTFFGGDRSGRGSPAPHLIFPWMGEPRLSNKDVATRPTDVDATMVFWASPVRLWVEFSDSLEAPCSITGLRSSLLAEVTKTKAYGPSYEDFVHPLSPYLTGEKAGAKAVGEERSPYREWPALALGTEGCQVAKVVQAFREERRFDLGEIKKRGEHLRLYLHGFDMPAGQAKVRGFFEMKTPLLSLEPKHVAELRNESGKLVAVADDICRKMQQAVKAALKRRPEDVKIPNYAATRRMLGALFWQETEGEFFETIRRLALSIETNDGRLDQTRAAWLKTLHDEAMQLFSRFSQERGQFSAADVRRVAEARNTLLRFTHPNGDEMRKLVGLSPLQAASPQGGRGTRQRAAAPRSQTTGGVSRQRSKK